MRMLLKFIGTSFVATILPRITNRRLVEYGLGMGKLTYSMNVSLDGFVETMDHGLDWGRVDEELHVWWSDEIRASDAFLYGRRVYEVMAAYWPGGESDPNSTPAMVEFARIWNPKPKVVFSRTLDSVAWNSRLVEGDVAEVLATLREEFSGALSVAGPTLAAQFARRNLIDEYRLVVHPVILGAGTPFFPTLDRPIDLELIDERSFASGVRLLGYAVRR
jgi:dihydrofolate reductase